MSTSSNTTFEFDVNHNGEFKLNPLTYQHGSLLNIYVPQMGFEDMVSYLKWKIPRQINTLYYMLPPNYPLSGMKQIKNDYHTNVMYDIAKVIGKLQIFISHTQIDLSTVLIPNDGSLEESFAGVISKETEIKLEESLSYLHQMQKKKFDYYELLGELGFINKTKPHTPYTQTVFNFVVHNSGQLVLDETNNTMYANGGTFNINIPKMKLADLKEYLLNIVAQYKLEIYIDHIGVNFVIHKYIFPNSSLAEMMNHVITDYSSENEGIIRQETQNDYTSDQMVEWAEQEHFEYEETKGANCGFIGWVDPPMCHKALDVITRLLRVTNEPQRIQAAEDRQKSYADLKRNPMEFEVGDRVMLKVSPVKGVARFGKRGKLNPRYVRPFKVLAKVGMVAYRLELPQELSRVHHTFHVSNLKKCYTDEPLAMPLEGIHVDDKLQFMEEPVEIMKREFKRLKQSRIPLVKVRWNSRRGPEFTWEREDSFKQKYPQLFTNRTSSSTTRS
ncbi:hypothetical protein Tco_0880468 [Tanacetum coccineum]